MLRQHDSTIDNAETTSNDHNTEYDSLSSSSSSIIDEDIDFDLVYSMHTFEATVEGQASVEKGGTESFGLAGDTLLLFTVCLIGIPAGFLFDLFLFDLFIEADIREIPELGELVASKIIDQVSDDNWSEILFIGWKTKNYSLKNAALSYIRINWEKIKRGRKINEVIAHGDMELIDELMYTICFGVILAF
ncbi:6814_t:CDS:2 [Entrophospora sp. SA101]|nr:6814_t:CDS:2 [Entrophospora sp. SA101]